MRRDFFDARNAQGASVYDVETGEQLRYVEYVDALHGEVSQFEQPLRVDGDELVTFVTRFRTIYPIYGGAPIPQLFHCYGRVDGVRSL